MTRTFCVLVFLLVILATFGIQFAGFAGAVTAEILREGQEDPGRQPVPSASTFLNNLYAWMLGVVGLASLFALVYGGVLYIFSGAIDSTAEAKRWMTNAFFGLLIAGASYLILRTINPELVRKFDVGGIVYKYCIKTAKTAEQRANCERARGQ